MFRNASQYLGCQLPFACEHKNLSGIDDPEMWDQAKRIARDTLDGKIWLADIGDFAAMNAVWDAWVIPGQTPARATVQARLNDPKMKAEIMVVAAI